MPGSFQAVPPATGFRRLTPVVLSVPTPIQNLRGRPRVAILSRLARVAVRLSARFSDLPLATLTKDAEGVPQPCAGVYWSVTHKSEFVAGVVAAAPVGIDIEHIRPRSAGLYGHIATAEEWRLGKGIETHLFYRVWTAKEAVLKAEKIGLRGLSHCRVTAIPDRDHMRLEFDRRPWMVAHYYLSTHVVALTQVADRIQWHIEPRWSQRR
ncbi:MAG: 4'-phosphopantetheinyl transferase superfamily protein [Desulfosarcina sp.]|nr:4'-phosphopantetheinyl transferase superfamily protein [Desulfobacterales bacterium]